MAAQNILTPRQYRLPRARVVAEMGLRGDSLAKLNSSHVQELDLVLLDQVPFAVDSTLLLPPFVAPLVLVNDTLLRRVITSTYDQLTRFTPQEPNVQE